MTESTPETVGRPAIPPSARLIGSGTLVEKLAEAAWHTLNHDNCHTDGQEHNTANWNLLCERIGKVLKSHRRKSPNTELRRGAKEPRL